MNLLIIHGTIITMCNQRIIRNGAIAVEDRSIAEVGKTHELQRKYTGSYERIDAKGKVVIPDLINTHKHAAMSLMRGYSDDLPLQEWLEKRVWPLESHMTPHDIYAGALLTVTESIMSGVTTVNTMYHYAKEKNEAKAFADAGLRGVIGHVCFSQKEKQDRNALEHLVKEWHNKADGLIRTSVDPHAPYTVEPEYMRELKEIHKRFNRRYESKRAPIIWHMHAAETDDELNKIREAFQIQPEKGIIKYLDSLDVLDKHVVAAHCVAVTKADIETLKERKVKVAHNPTSNLKLASGVSPIPRMLRENITVSIGTDGPCSNNTADMFDAMKITALIHKGINKDPTLLPASKVLEMATLEGAASLSWENEIGSIENGKKADLVIINFKKPHLCPLYNERSHLVYAVKSTDVETVIINGKIVMENRQLTTVYTEEVMRLAEKSKENLAKKSKQ